MTKRGAKKYDGKYDQRFGKSYEDLRDFNILGFMGGGLVGSQFVRQETKSFGVGKNKTSESLTSNKSVSDIGLEYDVFKHFPLFRRGSNPYYKIYDLPTNLGIVRTRQRSIIASEKRIQKFRDEIKSFGRKTDKRTQNKIETRRRYIDEELVFIKKCKHEMDYRLKFLKVISKNLLPLISNKGSLRKPSKNGKWKCYYFRIYFWGKRQSVYLGYEKDLKMGFKRQTKHNDFEEYLKDYGRKRFLMKLGLPRSNVSFIQREMERLKSK